jgi:hypothetical protein
MHIYDDLACTSVLLIGNTIVVDTFNFPTNTTFYNVNHDILIQDHMFLTPYLNISGKMNGSFEEEVCKRDWTWDFVISPSFSFDNTVNSRESTSGYLRKRSVWELEGPQLPFPNIGKFPKTLKQTRDSIRLPHSNSHSLPRTKQAIRSDVLTPGCICSLILKYIFSTFEISKISKRKKSCVHLHMLHVHKVLP